MVARSGYEARPGNTVSLRILPSGKGAEAIGPNNDLVPPLEKGDFGTVPCIPLHAVFDPFSIYELTSQVNYGPIGPIENICFP